MPKRDPNRRPAEKPSDARPTALSALIDEASDESFPASDAPPYTASRVGVPDRKAGGGAGAARDRPSKP